MARKESTLEVVDFFSAAVLGAVAAVEEAQCPILRGLAIDELRISHGRANYDGTSSEQGTAGVRIQVVKGFVRPEADRIKALRDRMNMNDWAKLLAKKFSIRPSAADAHIKQAERVCSMDGPSRKGGTERPVMGLLTQGKNAARDDAANSTCSFKILSVGDGTDGWFLLHDLVGKVVDANHLAWRLNKANAENPKHPAALGLRPALWTHTVATHKLELEDAKALYAKQNGPNRDLDVLLFPPSFRGCGLNGDTEMWNVDLDPPRGDWAGGWRDPKDASAKYPTHVFVEAPLGREVVNECVAETFCTGELSALGYDEEKVQLCFDFLREYGSQALYKSLMQKIVRTMPESVELPDLQRTKVPPYVVMFCTVALCLSTHGTAWNPDIGKSVRGCTAAFKRAAIIMIEDGALDFEQVPWLLGMALLTERCTTYHPVLDGTVETIVELLCGNSLGEIANNLLLWRSPEEMTENIANGLIAKRAMSVERLYAMQYQFVLPLFKSVGGMSGDFDMLRAAVPMFVNPAFEHTMCTHVEVEVLEIADQFEPLEYTMPLIHAIDQHVTPGVMHFSASKDDAERDDPNGYERRFRDTWAITGYNTRTRGVALDEADEAVVRLRSAQRAVFVAMTQSEDEPQVPSALGTVKLFCRVQIGAVSGGVGDIKLEVDTSADENKRDGLTLGEFARSVKWRLIACFDATLENVNLAWQPTAHVAEAAKKPRITETARKKANAKLYAEASKTGLKFSSGELPQFKTLHYVPAAEGAKGGEWVLVGPDTRHHTGLPRKKSSDPAETPLEIHTEMELLKLPADGLEWREEKPCAGALRCDETVLACLAYNGPAGIVGSRETALDSVVNITKALPANQRLRMLTLLRGAYTSIVMPTAPRSGKGVGSDQLAIAESGDWDVWRALVLIARIVPGALKPSKRIPRFDVVSARALKVVAEWVGQAHKEDEGVVGSLSETYQRGWSSTWSEAKAHMAKQEPPLALRPHQLACIDRLWQTVRGGNDGRGQVLALSGGMGKTITGMSYLVKYARNVPGVEAILWFTSSTTLSGKGPATEHVQSLTQEWGFPNIVHVNTDKSQKRDACEILELSLLKARKSAEKKAVLPRIFVIGYEHFSSYGNTEERARFVRILRESAPRCIACFDEAHLLYNPGTLRGTYAISIAERCMHVLLSTATPTAGTRQLLAERWIQLVTPFEVHKGNVHAAASRILGASFANKVKTNNVSYTIAIDIHVSETSNNHAKNGDWRNANKVVRDYMKPKLCDAAIAMALDDRKENEGGGVLLAVENKAEATECIAYINQKRGGFAAFYDPLTSNHDGKTGVVVGLALGMTGVDLPRLGGMIWLPTSGNVNTLEQLRMRSTREKQKRSEIKIVTLVPKDTVLQRLYERQQYDSSRSASIKEICKTYVENTGGKRRKM